jgi:hypothetical protein
MYSVELDGIYFGKLKCKTSNDIDIDRRGDKAKIVPFAQSEMAERFLFGIDADMQRDILAYVRSTMDRAVKEITKMSGFDAAAVITADEYAVEVTRYMERLKRKSRDETLDMVDFMPKQELAYAAEAIVNLTSIKRKVSAQQETVGGPVDVAMVTRNEGFVWIKRKHYFEMELNPAYPIRAFGDTKTEDRHDRPKKTTRRDRGAGGFAT